VGGDLEIGLLADGFDRPLQRAIGEGGELAALLADQVVMVLLGVDPLITGSVAADLDPLHEVEPVQLIQGAVDACPADRVKPPVDLQRRHRAGLAGK